MPTTGVSNQDENAAENSPDTHIPNELHALTQSSSGEHFNASENSSLPSEVTGVVSSTTIDSDSLMEDEQLTSAAIANQNEDIHDRDSFDSIKPLSSNDNDASGSDFQSAFAAFASASTTQENVETMEVDDTNTNDVDQPVTYLQQEEACSTVEQTATPFIDSDVTTTQQESVTNSDILMEMQQTVSVQSEDLTSKVDLDQDKTSEYASAAAENLQSDVVLTDDPLTDPTESSQSVLNSHSAPNTSVNQVEGMELQSIDETVESFTDADIQTSAESFHSSESSSSVVATFSEAEHLPNVNDTKSVFAEQVSTAESIKEILPQEDVAHSAFMTPSEPEVGVIQSNHVENIPHIQSEEQDKHIQQGESATQILPEVAITQIPVEETITQIPPDEGVTPEENFTQMQLAENITQIPSGEDITQMQSEGDDITLMQPEHFTQMQTAENITQIESGESISQLPPEDDMAQMQSGENFTQMQPAENFTQIQSGENITHMQPDESVASDAVYFIQMADSTGEIITSIIDPNDIPAYSDSVVYKQCMGADGQIETTIVSSGGVPVGQPEQQSAEEPSAEQEQQVIYAHDLNGHLTPIDSTQSASDVAPPGKQFVYMQDSAGRIIRTIMDANQTMVPGQQVYYTQSDDGRIITSVMDSTGSDANSGQQQQQISMEETSQLQPQQTSIMEETTQLQAPATSAFSMGNNMSGLNMLAELSHLTAGLETTERKETVADNSQDEFRPVAMITRRVTDDGVEQVKSNFASLKFSQLAMKSESLAAKLAAEIQPDSVIPGSVSRDNLFVQWQNLDAMCWMDVVLIMLVYSPTLRPLVNLDPSHELASTLLITLLKANRQAQVLLQNLLKNSAPDGVVLGGTTTPAARLSKLVCKENMDEIGKAINILYAMREKIWQALQPRLRCERGKHNSPVLVLPLLVREKPIIKQMFTMNYRYVFKCARCGYSQDDSHTKILPTIPAVPADFSMKEPCFVRNCFECQAPAQRMVMKFEGLQDFVQMHFVKGLPHNRFDELSFEHNGDLYQVTGVVHYKNNPDHFIAWVRNAPGNTWMECDDLKSVITRYQAAVPNIAPSQVHMVMWERRLAPSHTMIMRDTEDTKLLASQVLTVQLPASSVQGNDSSASNAKRQAIPQKPATTASTLPQAGTATSFLSNLMTQSQTTSINQTASATPRGRGRGGRGSRARGGTIRRAAPAVGAQMPTPKPSTQIIRLPMSALQGVNSNLRATGGNPAQRYILVGGNNAQSAQQGASQSGSKVVVLRSQGGANAISNLSASQLLQLLQQSGALSSTQTGGLRINTQIVKPSGDGGNVAGTSQILGSGAVASQQLGTASISSSATTDSVQTMTSEPEPTETAVSTAISGSTITTLNDPTPESSHPVTASSALENVAADTQNPENNVTEMQNTETSTDSSAVQSQATSVVESSVSASNVVNVTSAPTGTIRTLSMNPGEPARYIQIPNSSGSGSIMTQLVMKGGKMVLVPVDKNAQVQSGSSQSVIRLPGGSIKISQPTVSAISSDSAIIQAPVNSSTTTVSSSQSQTQYITLPGTQSSGNKRTIQFITVPRGGTSSASGQSVSKTIIVSPAGTQSASRISGDSESVSTQAGAVGMKDMKSDGGLLTLNNSIAVQASEMENVSDSSSVNLKSSTGTLAEELLTGHGVSLLSASPSKQQESFKYIIPSSSLHQMSSIQNISGGPQTGPAFTALSSSGTIIGGQLTPAGAISMDQFTPTESVTDVSQNTVYTAINEDEFSTTRGKGRGRGGQRGKGRGSRGRGRGSRQQQSEVVASTTAPMSKIVKRGGTISMLSADFRQVGGQIIESTTENVDGVPVVSIPDFSDVSAMHAESMTATESLTEDIIQTSNTLSDSTSSSAPLQDSTANISDPSIITQTIPSIKSNHGFDILTQGILGASGQPIRKSGISLLTGKHVDSSFVYDPSKTHQTLSHGQSVTQNDIDTLIQAAQGAAKPPKPGHVQAPAVAVSPASLYASTIDQVIAESVPKTMEENTLPSKDAIGEENPIDELPKPLSSLIDAKDKEDDGRVVSVDESQVSTAERYRMPSELFQPDEESPEKPVKSDGFSQQISGSQILGDEMPSKLFQDSEMSSQEDDSSASPQHIPKSPSKLGVVSPEATLPPVTTAIEEANVEVEDVSPSGADASDIELKEHLNVDTEEVEPMDVDTKVLSPYQEIKHEKKGKRGRSRGSRGRGRGRKKSASTGDSQEVVEATSPLHPVEPVVNEISNKEESIVDKLLEEQPIEPVMNNTVDEPKEICDHVGSPNAEVKEIVENLPAKVNVRPCVDWANEEVLIHPSFNYKVLTRKKREHHRHPSLGPIPTSFTSPPDPLPEPRERIDMRLPMCAYVDRQRYKPLERPLVDPSKEPTVIPLVAELDADPAYTGGSVVTSHTDGEVFTGVIVRQRRENADWSCGVEDDEEEEISGDDVTLKDAELKFEYAETMWTAMCMEVGDFSCFWFPDEEENDFHEDSSIVSDDEAEDPSECHDNAELKETPDGNGSSIEPVTTEIDASQSQPNGKRIADNDTCPMSPKRTKVNVDTVQKLEISTVDIKEKCLSSEEKVEIVPAKVNGISCSNGQSESPSFTKNSPLPVTSEPSGDNSESFISPARRSRRTPIPSFKIREYAEEKSSKPSSRVRKSSVH